MENARNLLNFGVATSSETRELLMAVLACDYLLDHLRPQYASADLPPIYLQITASRLGRILDCTSTHHVCLNMKSKNILRGFPWNG